MNPSEPPMELSLIEKLRAISPNFNAPELSERAYAQAVADCIEIIRQHTVTQNEIMSRGLPSRVDTEASGLTFATDEAQAETLQSVSWSLPCEGITGDLDPALPSEILDNDEECRQDIHDAVVHGLRHYFSDHVGMTPADIGSATKRIMGKVWVALRSAKPVPVSVHRCIIAAVAADKNPLDGYRAIVKAVLDAAGVKYVD